MQRFLRVEQFDRTGIGFDDPNIGEPKPLDELRAVGDSFPQTVSQYREK